MANLRETATWEAGIYQWETSDPVMGGENGIDNKPTRQLASRTLWLKTELAKAVASIGSNKTAAEQAFALKATAITAGAGLTGGGNLSANRVLSMGKPSKITATSTDAAISGTHSHSIDKASTTVAGIVMLVDALTSTDKSKALTAAQGKVLADLIAGLGDEAFKLRGSLGSRNLNDVKGTAGYGVWHQGGNAGATDALNYPAKKAGTLLVMPAAYQGIQLYIPYDWQLLYIRHSDGAGVYSAWRIIGEVTNTLTSDSFTAALSAAMGKKLAQEKADKTDVLGNSGSQDLNGYLTINNNNWGRLAMPTNDGGKWVVEVNPAGAGDPRMNFLFAKPSGGGSLYIRFPPLNKNETVAYQSYVADAVAPKANKATTLSGYGITDAATKAELTGAINGLIDDAPAALNTLKELAAAISNNAGYADTVTAELGKTVKTSGNQTVAGIKTFANQLKISGAANLSLYNWRSHINMLGDHGALMLNDNIGIGLHRINNQLVFLDVPANRAGFTYKFTDQTLSVAGDGTFAGISVAALNRAKANDNQVVKLTGNQTVDGIKTALQRWDFAGGLRFKGSAKNEWAVIGMGSADIYLHNPISNKYLALKDAGELHYDGQRVVLWRDRSDAVNLNDTNKFATSKAVKAAYDAAARAAPVGTVAFVAGTTTPAGWLKANGAAVSRTTYAALYAAIGTRYGAGDGSTTFNLPDLRGEFVRGWDDGRGVDKSRVLGSRQADEVRSHNHANGIFNQMLRPPYSGSLTGGDAGGSGSEQAVGTGDAAEIKAYGGAETRPRNIALMAVIKI
ncbi:tail fiber protein [Uruburuella testudinis]|uniref:Tail fiber protein n=1 Tax=Uruburuella testudinis TaxID=1282863 RepID=A0ABY4DUP8_9NEIS|nr:tail fiber protein [Uruburuella testudinis]UOO82757.1 tail fiber protein [Uruburuella testudinis]